MVIDQWPEKVLVTTNRRKKFLTQSSYYCFDDQSPILIAGVSVSKSEDRKALSAFSISSRHRRFLESSPAAPIPLQPEPLDQWGGGRGVRLANERGEVCVLPGILVTHLLAAALPCVQGGSQHCWAAFALFLTFNLFPLSLLSLLCHYQDWK